MIFVFVNKSFHCVCGNNVQWLFQNRARFSWISRKFWHDESSRFWVMIFRSKQQVEFLAGEVWAQIWMKQREASFAFWSQRLHLVIKSVTFLKSAEGFKSSDLNCIVALKKFQNRRRISHARIVRGSRKNGYALAVKILKGTVHHALMCPYHSDQWVVLQKIQCRFNIE